MTYVILKIPAEAYHCKLISKKTLTCPGDVLLIISLVTGGIKNY